MESARLTTLESAVFRITKEHRQAVVQASDLPAAAQAPLRARAEDSLLWFRAAVLYKDSSSGADGRSLSTSQSQTTANTALAWHAVKKWLPVLTTLFLPLVNCVSSSLR